jgi:hypothetical protein
VPEEYLTIQSAIDSAADGDTVLLSPGTYRGPGNRDIAWLGKNLVVKSSHGPQQTIIDCETLGRGFYVDWAYPVESSGSLEGLTIRNGWARHESPDYGRGGGIFCASSIAIRDCRIERCEADSDGGGLYLIVFDGVVDRCVFLHNRSDDRGGGVYFEVGHGLITNCILANNQSDWGGGICFGGPWENRLFGSTVVSNIAFDGGGGIWAGNRVLLERCIVWDNCSMAAGHEIRGPGDFRGCDIDRSGVYSSGGNTYDENCIDADPMFCLDIPCGSGGEGSWMLGAESPCLPEHSPSGELIGALGWGCEISTQPGACCLVEGGCVVVSEYVCSLQQGSYQGNGTLCQPDPCGATPTERTSWGRIKAAFR